MSPLPPGKISLHLFIQSRIPIQIDYLLYIIIALIVTNLLSQVLPAVLVALLTTALLLGGVCYGSTYDETTCYCADHERFANDSTLRNLIWKQNREYGMSAQIYKPQGTTYFNRDFFATQAKFRPNSAKNQFNSKGRAQYFQYGNSIFRLLGIK